jgi:hypothetical protein
MIFVYAVIELYTFGLGFHMKHLIVSLTGILWSGVSSSVGLLWPALLKNSWVRPVAIRMPRRVADMSVLA